MIGKEVAHYKILDRLGGGGMGVVYKAEDTRLGRIVALKFLNTELLANDSLRRRFLHEARAASVIDHPNVCHVYEVGEEDGRYFMAMSYCEGRSLRDVIKSGPSPPRESFSIAFGIAQGLWAAHRRHIVHRDIKPANVILTDEGFVRIVDFGLALLIGDSRVTTSGVTVGTIAYMSPEQTSGSNVSANTDIWSLGVTLYELLTGHLPFRGDVNAALVYSIVHEPYTPLPDSVPPACARIVDRCLEKDPAKRYQTIEELLEDMVKASQELGWESSMASATIAPILRERRRKILTRRFAVATSVVVILAGGWFAWHKLRVRSPYTTEVRLAVLPLDNMTGAENDMLVAGLSEHLSRVSRWVAQRHASMWTVPYLSILNADLPSPKAARDAFGSNRVLTGNVQRFGSAYRVNLKLFDTRSGRVLKSAAIRFDTHRPEALNDTLLVATARILGMRDANVAACPLRSSNALAIPLYLEGIARLREAGTTGPVDRAAALLDSCVTIDPNFAAGLCAAGNAELQQYRRHPDSSVLARALEHGRKSLGSSPRYAEADILVGESFQRMQMPDSVEHYLRAATVAEPTLLTAYQRLGNFYVAQKRLDEAEATYRKLIVTCPDFWAAHLRLGLFCFEQRRVDDAQASWETALTLAPHDPLTLNNLGAVHHRRGEWAKARVLFLQSFQARPDCESCDNVALTHYFEGNFEDAAKYFEFALQYCDTTTDVPWGDLARALYWTSTGRPRSVSLYNKALLLARTSLRDRPEDVQLMTSIMEYEAMSDNTAGAREVIERVRPLLKDDGHAMYRVASVEEKLGERTAALDLIADAIRHEFPIAEIRGDPMLRELTEDPRFLEMVHNEAAAEGAQAAGKAP